VSQCSKNKQGAEAFGAFTRVISIVLRRCADPISALVEGFRTGRVPDLPTYRQSVTPY